MAVVQRTTRQEAAEDTRQRILAAAEQVFADESFSGASMRAIADGAGVAQGLLHYHFENKRSLYASVVGWRAGLINAERIRLLDAADPADLGAILEALFRPALAHNAGGGAYARIMASMVTGDAMHQALVREHYDATAGRFIAAVQRCTGFDRREAAWGYSLAIHVMVAGMARSGRTERLAGEPGPASREAFLAQLIAFAVGGIKGLGDRETPLAATGGRP